MSIKKYPSSKPEYLLYPTIRSILAIVCHPNDHKGFLHVYLFKSVNTEKELLTHTQIVDIVREKYDICSKKNNNTSGAPKFFISDLLAIFNDECDRVFYTYYGSTGYCIKRIFTGIDSIEAVFDKIDKLLNDNAAIYVITKNNDYLLTRSAVRISNEIRKNAPQIDIYDLI